GVGTGITEDTRAAVRRPTDAERAVVAVLRVLLHPIAAASAAGRRRAGEAVFEGTGRVAAVARDEVAVVAGLARLDRTIAALLTGDARRHADEPGFEATRVRAAIIGQSVAVITRLVPLDRAVAALVAGASGGRAEVARRDCRTGAGATVARQVVAV